MEQEPPSGFPQGGSDGLSRNKNINHNNIPFPLGGGQEGATDFYRMDVELVGADRNAMVIAEGEQSYIENYYLPQCRDGATAHSYSKVTYKNVYPNIDWVVYVSPHPASPQGGSDMSGIEGASLKYDFIVHAGGDVSQIKLRYNGATSLQLKDGALVAETPYGTVTEEVPYSYYAGSKEEVSSSFKLNGNILSYSIPNSNSLTLTSQSLIIDPGINWSTYYGGSGSEAFVTLSTDSAANVYTSGQTNSTNNIATSGAFQTSYISRMHCGFVVKFDSTGTRQWGSYYGGNARTHMFGTAADAFGDIYMAGETEDTGLATAGVYMSSKPALYYAPIIIKFNGTNGSRVWATYYDSVGNTSWVMACDRTGSLYISRGANVSGLATTGAFQTSINGIDPASLLMKFNSSGSRVWATYYYMYSQSLTVDKDDNICLGGSSITAGLATSGAFRSTGPGAYLVKFSPSGARLWGTYCGDNSEIYSLTCDVNNNIYIGGKTSSTIGIATPGAFKTTFAGFGSTGFIAKFNDAGTSRFWGTYYDVMAVSLSCDSKCNLYAYSDILSATPSVITPNAYQSTFGGGGADAVLAIFNTNGVRRYGTYFGGSGADQCWGSVAPSMSVVKDKIYMCGSTNSTSGISTTNAHQPIYGGSPLSGYGDLFLVQFQLDTQVYIKQPFKDTLLCGLDTMHIPYGVNRPFRASNTFTFQLSDASGSFASPTNLGTASGSQRDSIFKWRVTANITAGSGYRVRVLASAPIDTAYEDNNIKLRPMPLVTPGSNSPLCSGNTLSFTAPTTLTGVVYIWTGPGGFTGNVSNPIITSALPAHSGKYVVTTTLNGCTTKDSIINVIVNQSPATPTATSNAPICEGADLKLMSGNTIPGVTYSWTGPGFTSPLQNSTIASATAAATGTYTVTSTLGSCTTTNTVAVAINVGPTIFAYPSPGNTICTGKKLTMVGLATPASGGTAFQWQKDGVDVPGATAVSYSPPTVADGDMYSVKMIPAASYGCTAPINSNGVTITVLPDLSPSVLMTASDTNSWPGLTISFTATAADVGTAPKYQWKLNGKNVVSATSNIWGAATLSNNDSVCVEVTSTYLCPSPATATACKKVKVATGVHGVTSSRLRIWPNPVLGQLNIEGLVAGTIIQIADVYGRVVYRGVAKQDDTHISTEGLVPGNYILQVTDAGGQKDTYKLVKQ